MLERIATAICVAATLGSAALFVMKVVNNPLDGRRIALASDLRTIKPVEEDYSVKGPENYDALRDAITTKRAIWTELIEPPPPPPPRVKVIPPPDFEKLLRKVSVARGGRVKKGGVVVKVRFHHKGGGVRGVMHEVGDLINGCEILSFNKDSVTFGFNQGGKKYTYELPM
jgi:hypothetical protein